jgi:hypothetical protein
MRNERGMILEPPPEPRSDLMPSTTRAMWWAIWPLVATGPIEVCRWFHPVEDQGGSKRGGGGTYSHCTAWR